MKKSKKWDLGVYAYPGGTVYANKAREVSGDYEGIAFISSFGLLRWDMPREAVDPVIRARIDLDAARIRSEALKALNREIDARPAATLDRLCDMAPVGMMIAALDRSGSLADKARALVEYLIRDGRL